MSADPGRRWPRVLAASESGDEVLGESGGLVDDPVAVLVWAGERSQRHVGQMFGRQHEFDVFAIKRDVRHAMAPGVEPADDRHERVFPAQLLVPVGRRRAGARQPSLEQADSLLVAALEVQADGAPHDSQGTAHDAHFAGNRAAVFAVVAGVMVQEAVAIYDELTLLRHEYANVDTALFACRERHRAGFVPPVGKLIAANADLKQKCLLALERCCAIIVHVCQLV